MQSSGVQDSYDMRSPGAQDSILFMITWSPGLHTPLSRNHSEQWADSRTPSHSRTVRRAERESVTYSPQNNYLMVTIKGSQLLATDPRNMADMYDKMIQALWLVNYSKVQKSQSKDCGLPVLLRRITYKY
jgi:hypothetical protein